MNLNNRSIEIQQNIAIFAVILIAVLLILFIYSKFIKRNIIKHKKGLIAPKSSELDTKLNKEKEPSTKSYPCHALVEGSFLCGSLSNSYLIPSKSYYSKLGCLGLEYLIDSPLYLCIISLDNYQRLLLEYNEVGMFLYVESLRMLCG